MNTEDRNSLEQQRMRRSRIDRMKSRIIALVAVWMVVSMLAIIALGVSVVYLNHKVDRLVESRTVNVNTESELGTAEPATDAIETQTAEEISDKYDHVLTGIEDPDNVAQEGDEHKVYLTFDGSPSSNTLEILKILQKNNVKATFFVNGDESEESDEIYREIVKQGHTLGMHSYSNQYSVIYESAEAFYDDYKKLSDHLYDVTGQRCRYYRFPGGSSNEISNVNMAEFVHVLNEEHITYFDWNVAAGDTAAVYTADALIDQVTAGIGQYKTSVVLLQDGDNKSTTVEALDTLIQTLLKMNAQILPIDENTTVIQYIKADSVG